MKIRYISIGLILLMAACSTGDLDQKKKELEEARKVLKEKKAELDEQKEVVEAIEEELKKLDPEYAKLLDKSVKITTVSSTPTTFEHRFQVRGEIASRKNVNISAEMGGTVNAIHVKEGQQVSAGQTLISLDAKIMNNSIAELKTALELATSIFEKRERLWKQNVGTEIDYLQAKNNKESLERKLATTQSQLSKLYIKSPFAGIVDKIIINPGELATPGFPIITLTSPKGMYITADVSERFIGKFNRGDKVGVFFPVQDTLIESTISAVSQVINPENRTFEIEVNMPAANLVVKPNQIAVVHLTDYKNEKAFVVETRMIQVDETGQYIFEAVDDEEKKKKVAKKVYIKSGQSYEGKTEVVQGLKGNELLVNKGFRELSEGTEVKIFESDAEVAQKK